MDLAMDLDHKINQQDKDIPVIMDLAMDLDHKINAKTTMDQNTIAHTLNRNRKKIVNRNPTAQNVNLAQTVQNVNLAQTVQIVIHNIMETVLTAQITVDRKMAALIAQITMDHKTAVLIA